MATMAIPLKSMASGGSSPPEMGLVGVAVTSTPIHEPDTFLAEDEDEYDSRSDPTSSSFSTHLRGSLTTLKSRLVDLYNSNVGLLLISASQLCLSCMTVCVKFLNRLDPPVSPLELVWVRMIMTYIIATAYMVYREIPYPFIGPPGVRGLLIIRGMSGFFGLFGIYYSLQYLSLADATVLTFLTPSVTAFAGYLILGEDFSRKQAAAGLLSLVGVVLIARPEAIFGPSLKYSSPPGTGTGDIIDIPSDSLDFVTSAQRVAAVVVSLVGVLGATGAYISIRAIGKRAHALHTTQWFSAWAVVVSTIGFLVLPIKIVIPTTFTWAFLLFAIGIFGFSAQVFLTLGLQRETASRGSLAMYVQIIFALAFEISIFHVIPSSLSMLGTTIILGCAIFVALNKPKPRGVPQTRTDHVYSKLLTTNDEDDDDGSVLDPDEERGLNQPITDTDSQGNRIEMKSSIVSKDMITQK